MRRNSLTRHKLICEDGFNRWWALRVSTPALLLLGITLKNFSFMCLRSQANSLSYILFFRHCFITKLSLSGLFAAFCITWQKAKLLPLCRTSLFFPLGAKPQYHKNLAIMRLLLLEGNISNTALDCLFQQFFLYLEFISLKKE